MEVHVASALGSEGVGHVTHEAAVPHWSVLSFGKHPLVAGQVWVPAPHTTPQAAFTQAVPVGHGVQSTPFIVPQVSEELLLTQTPLHRCHPASHAETHDPEALQVTLPLSGAMQAMQLLPHELTFVLPLTTQVVLAPVPHT